MTGLEADFEQQEVSVGVREEKKRRLRMDLAKRDYNKVKRRWDRRLSWVVEGNSGDGPHSLWRAPSVVKRDEARLAAI